MSFLEKKYNNSKFSTNTRSKYENPERRFHSFSDTKITKSAPQNIITTTPVESAVLAIYNQTKYGMSYYGQ